LHRPWKPSGLARQLGWKKAVAAHYSREADLSKKMRRVVRRMEQANTRGTKVSTNAE
jgi:hypothetical protein